MVCLEAASRERLQMAAGRLREATAKWLLSFTFLTSNLKVLCGIDRARPAPAGWTESTRHAT